jgi:hypothetical protein
MAEGEICPNCGAAELARYCAACGQQRPKPHDTSAAWFLREVFEALSSTESKVYLTFRTLLFHPGKLTLDYFEGRRQRYLKPVQLFVACNVIFFLAQSVTTFNTLTTPLYVHLRMMPYSSLIRGRTADAMLRLGLSERQLAQKFDAITADQAKTLVFTMIPMLGLFLMLVLWRRHYSYGKHLVFATHFFSFMMLVMPVTQLLALGSKWLGAEIEGVSALLFMVYFFFATRQAYGLSKATAMGASILLFASMCVVLTAYRFLLFNAALISVR